jgi:threonine aldolase
MSATPDGYIDLRSDTVTRPTPEMRRAMADAEVGDDWYGDDPTVNRLQEDAAGLTGHEAALYLPTGTLCNQIALHAYVRSGGIVACEATAHVGGTEAASAAALSGIAFRRITAPRGLLSAEQVAVALEPDPYDVEHVGLVTVENTHQRGGGSVLPVADLTAIAKICASRDTPLYLDGARIFNAAVVAGSTVAEYTRQVDALMFCLSKGLGAPIGSLLAGSREFIAEARRLKILFGGAWRQAGIMAAAGLIALRDGPGRLAEDHANARRLAEGVAEIVPGSVDPASVQTNMVFVDVAGTGWPLLEWVRRLDAAGLRVTVVPGRVRMLTHADVTAPDIETALAAWRRAAGEAFS